MNIEEKLQSVIDEIADREQSIKDIEPALFELIKSNIGKIKQPASIQTQRRKLQRHRERIKELKSVEEALEKEIADAEAKEADAQLQRRAGSIVDELKQFTDQVKAVNEMREKFEGSVAGLRHPLNPISDVILSCHETKKMDYINTVSIYKNLAGMKLSPVHQEQIDAVNLEIQTGLNRLNAALEGRGSYHKAKAVSKGTWVQAFDVTEAERIRQEMEVKRFVDGGPAYPQHHQS